MHDDLAHKTEQTTQTQMSNKRYLYLILKFENYSPRLLFSTAS